ncbi:unnamed protein product [Arabis nemorensis]|uniref:Uncharacterized protein n=1 Tax=Arabis nemorensis TaxID=586526 RepID=A0A565BPR5_9BRAS|nr:unnamed protein product [Arabis nemorensis]
MEASEVKSKKPGASRLFCLCNQRRPVLKRPKTIQQALDQGAALLKVDKLVTGHNADDIAESQRPFS